VFFGVYGNVVSRLQLERDAGRPLSKYAIVFAAGAAAGFTQTVVACPSDLVKVILQSQLNSTGTTTAFTLSVEIEGKCKGTYIAP